MSTSKQISQLSVLVTAATAGAVKDVKDLEEIAKSVGPSIARAFKGSNAEIIESYDKMLGNISRKFAQNNFSATSLAQLDKLKQFFQQQEAAFGDQARVRANLVNDLGAFYNQRGLKNTPDVQGLTDDRKLLPIEIENAMKRLDNIQKKIGSAAAEDIAPLVGKLHNLNTAFENMATRGLPLAEMGLKRVKELLVDARAIGGPAYLYSNLLPQISDTEVKLDSERQLKAAAKMMGMRPGDPLDSNYGPFKEDFLAHRTAERVRTLREGIRPAKTTPFADRLSQMAEDEDLAGLYAMRDKLERTRLRKESMGAGYAHHRVAHRVNKTIAEVEAQRQFDHDMPFANASLPPVLSQRDIDQDLAAQAQRRINQRINDARGFYSYKGGGLHESSSGVLRATPDWTQSHIGPSPFERRIGSMMGSADSVQELREIRHTLQKKVSGGNKKLTRQLDKVDRALKRAEKRGRYQYHGDDATGHVTDGPAMTRRGRGSASRQFRYVSQNLAYGTEDAIVSYGIGGIAGASRAATNNLTAIAGTMISNPIAMAGTIVGISVLGAALPPMIKWIEEANKGKDATEEFMKSYEKLTDKTKAGLDLDKLIVKGSAEKLTSKLESVTDDLDELKVRSDSMAKLSIEEAEKQKKNGGFSKHKTRQSLFGFSMEGEGFLDDRLLTLIDDVNWALSGDEEDNDVSLLTGEKHGEFSRKRKAALTAELNREKAQGEQGTIAAQQIEKEKELKRLQERLATRKIEEEALGEFKDGRSKLLKDLAYEEKFAGKQMNEKEFLDRLAVEQAKRQKQFMAKFGALNMKPEEITEAFKEEEKFFKKERDEGVKEIQLRERLEQRQKELAEKKRVHDANQSYGNSRMKGEKGEAYDRWFDAQAREKDLMQMPAGSKRDALLSLNRLDFEKGERAAWERDHPFQRKPNLEGMDAGTADDARLFNHYSYGRNEDPFKKQLEEHIKIIEGFLQTIAGNSEDRTEFNPKEA